MEILDRLAGIIGYAVIKAEDGSIEEIRGSSTSPLGDLAAFFSSAGEVIKNSLDLGDIHFLTLCYGNHRLVVFPYESKYLGIEIERDRSATELIQRVLAPPEPVPSAEVEPAAAAAPAVVELPHSLSSKVLQINYLLEEFGAGADTGHWQNILNQGIGILGGDMQVFIGVVNGKLVFKENPSAEKEDDFVQGLRSIIDFLVKKAVEEMGSAQARVKVQTVIEKMRKA